MPANIDLSITKIHVVQYFIFPHWSRSSAFPRYATGLIYVTEGTVKYNFTGKIIEAHAGDVLFLPKGVVYSGVSLSKVNSFYVIDFDCAENDRFIQFLPLQIKSVPEEIARNFERALSVWKSSEATYTLQCRIEIYKLICKVYEYYSRISGSRHEYVVEAIKYIQNHYKDQNLYIGQIADNVHVSESHLRRLFINDLGQSPMEYLQSCRIDHAKEMLLYGPESLGSIAEACGYSSLFYFSKIFKRMVGVSPTEFRNKEQSGSYDSVVIE